MSNSFTYRPALDGIRAVAVLSVIVYHVHEPWLPGGFLGVDLFFVLSGFLITSLLLVEHRTTDGIRLSRFWSRRARRLLPAILVLVVVVALVEHQAIAEAALRATRRSELLATVFYVANWQSIFAGSSYFAGYAGASPVRHTWSLAIEEQFYVLYPLLIAAGLLMRRYWLQISMVSVMIGSALLMAFLFDPANPTRAYYGTDTRVHQLLAGAILAMVLSGRHRTATARWARRLLPATAALLVAALFIIQDDGSFYYRGGAFLVGILAAALIAGLEEPSRLQRALSLRPFVIVGLVSYGLYLWHFPVVVWLVRFWAPGPPLLLAATLTLTAAAAAASYVFVERPIRVDRRLFGIDLTPRNLAFVVPIASLSVAAVVFAALPDTLPDWARDVDEASGLVVREAASSTTIPAEQEPASGSIAPVAEPVSVAIVGDSFMVSAYPGFRVVASESGSKLVEAAIPSCPVGYEPLAALDGNPHVKAERCVELTSSAYALLNEEPTDVVLWHDLQSVLPRFSDSGGVLVPGTTEWQDDLIAEWSRVLNEFVDSGMTVFVIKPPLRSQAADCAAVVGQLRCNNIQTQDETIRAATDAFERAAAGREGVYFLTVDHLLCPNGVPCPATVNGLVVREGGEDQTHFTEAGAEWFARELFQVVRELLVFD